MVVVNRLELHCWRAVHPRSAIVGGFGISSFHLIAVGNDDMVFRCVLQATGGYSVHFEHEFGVDVVYCDCS